MVDVVTKGVRSRMMAGIRAKNTKPEMQVRKHLHRLGFRYALHRRDLPGNPDIVLHKHHVAIMVHGCFWHGHSECKYAKLPSTRPEFWSKKIAANIARDRLVIGELRAMEWRVAIVWECVLRRDADPCLAEVVAFIRSDRAYLEPCSSSG
ncbi:very short patch repair endonuclease [Stenotrophomonas bentonitica]